MGELRTTRLWRPEEDRQLIQMLESGASHADISIVLDRPTSSVKGRIETLRLDVQKRDDQTAQVITTKPIRQERNCLCCNRTFLSAGPHNRMCDRCRIKAANDSNPFCA